MTLHIRLLFLFIALATLPLAAQNTPQPRLAMDQVSVRQGDTVRIPLRIFDFQSVIGFQYAHEWDSTKLAFIDIENFAVPEIGALGYFSPRANLVNIIYNDTTTFTGIPLQDSAVFYNVVFLALADHGADTIIFRRITTSPYPPLIYNAVGQELYDSTLNRAGHVRFIQEPVIISVDQVEGQTGDTVCVPVRCVNFQDVVAMQYSHTWNASQLSLIGVSGFGLPNLSSTNFNLGLTSRCIFQYNDLVTTGVTLPDNTVIYELCFLILGDSGTANICTGGQFMPPSSPAYIGNVFGDDIFDPSLQPCGGITISESVGTSEQEQAVNLLRAYPNPFSEVLTIHNTGEQSLQLRIVDSQGKCISDWSIAPGTHHRQVADWPSGLYHWQAILEKQVVGGTWIKQ